MRVARLNQRIAQLGFEVRDLGDMRIARPHGVAETGEKLKYLAEISLACEELSTEVRNILSAEELPIVLGGDHSIAIGSISGVTSYYRERNEAVGLIWFDAHADMNTPETTPSGNIHGMPLAVLLGYGAPELTQIADFSPKLEPRYCAHIGVHDPEHTPPATLPEVRPPFLTRARAARDVDQGERELIRKLGLRFFTMRE